MNPTIDVEIIVRGRTASGKTAILQKLREVLEAEGYWAKDNHAQEGVESLYLEKELPL